jgi:hypothetical protein
MKRKTSITPDGRTREEGLFWLGSMYPISKEIGDGLKKAQKEGWSIRIHLEPPGHVAFYVKVPANTTSPENWLRTVDEKGQLVHRRHS